MTVVVGDIHEHVLDVQWKCKKPCGSKVDGWLGTYLGGQGGWEAHSQSGGHVQAVCTNA